MEKWFKVNDPDTSDADPELDKAVQKELRRLKFKNGLQQLIEFERLYGKALLVGGFADAQTVLDLRNVKAPNAELLQVVAYQRYQTRHRTHQPKVWTAHNLQGEYGA